MSERNTELLEQTMQYILDHPEQHHQDMYWWDDCGTPGCFAGWAVVLSGLQSEIVKMGALSGNLCTSQMAEDLLGLTSHEGSTLFAGSNTIPQLQRMVKDLVNGEKLGFWDDYKVDT